MQIAILVFMAYTVDDFMMSTDYWWPIFVDFSQCNFEILGYDATKREDTC